MTSKIVIVVRLFIFIFAFCYVLMFLFTSSFSLVLVTAALLTALQGFNWLFVKVGMNILYKNDDGFQQAKKLGYDPYFDSLPSPINPNANRTCYVLPHPEPEYRDFVPPVWWPFQCLNCYGRLEENTGSCWNCGARLE